MNSHFLRAVKPGVGRFAVALLALAIAVLSFALTGIRSGAGADETRSTRTVELGRSGTMPNPACPGRPEKKCFVVASISGFQVENPQSESPFVVPFDGSITHYTLYLSKPTSPEREILNDQFGSPPQAAITILKKIRTSSGKQKYRLLRKGPVEGLNKYLGTKERIKLTTPLKVRKGNVVALAVPTWAPLLATGRSDRNNRWRASRQPGKCGDNSVKQSSPQLKLDSNRFYGCKFYGARLTYTATLAETHVPAE